jgi:hypothetical protein
LTLPAIYDPENVLNCPHDTSHQIEQQQQQQQQQSASNINSKKNILSNGKLIFKKIDFHYLFHRTLVNS